MKQIGALFCAALLMTACASPGVRDAGLDRLSPRKAERDLLSGIRAYEDGDYKNSSRLLNNALAAGPLLNCDKVVAHKYLAFMHCAQSREGLCRAEFRKALQLDPKFELAAAESGHPAWGPVFKSVKAQMAKRPN